MRALSYWASQHRIAARLIIVLSRITLLIISFFLAKEYRQAGLITTHWMFYGCVLFFIISCLFYPKARYAGNYWRRKVNDLFVIVSSFVLLFLFLVQLDRPFAITNRVAAATTVITDSGYKYPQAQLLIGLYQKGEKNSFTAGEKKILRKEFRYQLFRYSKAALLGNKKEKDNAGLIVLVIIGAIGLFALLAALCCTLSCNGSDAAAIILFLLGTAGIVLGARALIHSIKKKNNAPSANQ